MDKSELPIVERRGAVMWITLNRPQLRNALNAAILDALRDAVTEANESENVRCVVVTGAGDKAFSAGADLRPGIVGSPLDHDPVRPGHPGSRCFKLIATCDVPVVARVNGDAMAGGAALVAACDMAVAVDHARIGTPEVKIGIFPLHVVPYMMDVVPRKKLMEMTLTGEPFSAAEALAIGLVNYVVPATELDAKIDWLVGRIIDKSPTGIRLGKHHMNAMRNMSLDERVDLAEIGFPALVGSEDCREGLAAFNEKRAPKWTGR